MYGLKCSFNCDLNFPATHYSLRYSDTSWILGVHVILDLIVLIGRQAVLGEFAHFSYPLAILEEDEWRNAECRRDRG